MRRGSLPHRKINRKVGKERRQAIHTLAEGHGTAFSFVRSQRMSKLLLCVWARPGETDTSCAGGQEPGVPPMPGAGRPSRGDSAHALLGPPISSITFY